MSSVAAAIALGYGLVWLALFGHRSGRQPWLLAAFTVGAVTFPVTVLLVTPIQALVASLAGWDIDAYSTALGAGVVGAVTSAAVNEVFKLAAALLLWSMAGERGEPVAFGAAAGAGFGAWGAHQVISLALAAVGVGRRRVGTYLGGAVVWEALYGILGLLFALRLYSSLTWALLSVVAGVARGDTRCSS